jgi:transposase
MRKIASWFLGSAQEFDELQVGEHFVSGRFRYTRGLRDNELTKLLGWPGYRVYRHEINERAKTLKLWIRRKRGNRKLVCSGCGRKLEEAHDVSEREVRDLPCMEFRTTVVVEVYRVCCPDCGIRIEKVPQLPSKAPFSKRFEDAVGQACESASARQVARQFGLAASTVRAIDLRYLERWAATRRKPALVQMGVDEIHLGKQEKFITVVSNLETGEPVWFGRERKKETLDEFFEAELSRGQRMRITAACVDMWEPYRLSIEQHAPNCRIVYDKFHVMQHANQAVDEVRRAEFFRKGGRMRSLVKGKCWLLLTRWVNLSGGKRQELNQLFALNRKVFKAYLLKESLDRLWTYHYEGRDVELSPALDRSTPLAAPQAVPKAGHDAVEPPQRDSELLPNESAARCR